MGCDYLVWKTMHFEERQKVPFCLSLPILCAMFSSAIRYGLRWNKKGFIREILFLILGNIIYKLLICRSCSCGQKYCWDRCLKPVLDLWAHHWFEDTEGVGGFIRSRAHERGTVMFKRHLEIAATGLLSMAFGHFLKPTKRWNFGFGLKELNALIKASLVRDENSLKAKTGLVNWGNHSGASLEGEWHALLFW